MPRLQFGHFKRAFLEGASMTARSLYSLTVYGSLAGLLAWSITAWIPWLVPLVESGGSTSDVLAASLIGSMLTGCCIGADRLGDSVIARLRWVVAGALAGGMLGGVGAVAVWLLFDLGLRDLAPYWVRTLFAWALPGTCISLGLAYARGGLLIRRLLYSSIGGFAGGLLGGGCVLALGESWPIVSEATGLVLAGLCISLGSGLAVSLVQRATIEVVKSETATVAALPRHRWEVLRGDRYLFGRDPSSPQGERYIYVAIPDPRVHSAHATLHERSGKFVVRPHPANRDARGCPVHALSVQRPGALRPLVPNEEGIELDSGDVLCIGGTQFLFALRGRNTGRASIAIVGALLLVTALVLVRHTFTPIPKQPHQPTASRAGRDDAQGNLARASSSGAARAIYRLVPDGRGCLLEVDEQRGQPGLRFRVGLVDGSNEPVRIRIPDPARAQRWMQVLEDGHPLKVVRVESVGDWRTVSFDRWFMLLLDISGSMQGEKFEGMKAGAKEFVDRLAFVDGRDHIAVVPFESRAVEAKVRSADFLVSRAAVIQAIESLPSPDRKGNTALYSATRTALDVLAGKQSEHLKQGRSRFALVVMTDGMNEVGSPSDDPGLLEDITPVVQAANATQIPVFTIGFGRPPRTETEAPPHETGPLDEKARLEKRARLDEAALRKLARPTEGNYRSARNVEQLIDAFGRIVDRFKLVDLLEITFETQEQYRTQLVRSHAYTATMDVPEPVPFKAEGRLAWDPPGGLGAPPLECEAVERPSEAPQKSRARPVGPMRSDLVGRNFKVPPRDWIELYLSVLAGAVVFFVVALRWLPRLIWARDEELHVLRECALSSVRVEGRPEEWPPRG